ncbi:Protein of unknown function [Leuconostoc citreum LBAE E16]|nr:Protein of unknown function [Leuconostoc citreum LBAE E16]
MAPVLIAAAAKSQLDGEFALM